MRTVLRFFYGPQLDLARLVYISDSQWGRSCSSCHRKNGPAGPKLPRARARARDRDRERVRARIKFPGAGPLLLQKNWSGRTKSPAGPKFPSQSKMLASIVKCTRAGDRTEDRILIPDLHGSGAFYKTHTMKCM